MRVLVTGGAGYIGNVLVPTLVANGHEVKVLDLFTYGNHFEAEAKIVKGKITDIETVLAASKDVDAIIHLAAVVGDPCGNLLPDQTLSVNYLATENLVKVAKHLNIKKFIFSSTCSVYGFRDGTCYETTALNPISNYAKTKVLAEEVIRSVPEINPIILRFATVYGLSPRMRFDLVANLLIAKSLSEKKITVYGNGLQYRPLVHVRDIAGAVKMALENDVMNCDVFNVGSNEQNYTVKALAEEIQRNVEGAELAFIPEKEDNRSYKVDFSKISKLGYKTRFNLAHAVKEIKGALDEGIITDYRDKKFSNFKTMSEAIKKC